MDEIINFYKGLGFFDKKMNNYFNEHVKIIDFKTKKERNEYVGCFYTTKDNKIKNITIVIPKIKELSDTSICVHEIAHFIDLYSNRDKEYNENIAVETFPVAMERLFFYKTGDSFLINWFEKYQHKLINDSIKNDSLKNMVGFLNQFDYLNIYKNTNSLPNIVDFKINNSVDISCELKNNLNNYKMKILTK